MSTYVLRFFDPATHECLSEPTWTLMCGTGKVTEFYGHGPDGESVMDATDEFLRQCGEEPGYWRGCGGEWEIDTTGGHEPDLSVEGRLAWQIFLDQRGMSDHGTREPSRLELIAYWRSIPTANRRSVYYDRARRYLEIAREEVAVA